jgi:cation diffusion facilitator family transporter
MVLTQTGLSVERGDLGREQGAIAKGMKENRTMHLNDIHPWQHAHTFGTDAYHPGEHRTRWVIALTASMMVVEIVAGLAFGSMALLADGWHMATHAAALAIAAFAYAYARRRANDRRYSFGTGKVAALGGFASAVSLAVVALLVLAESVSRLASPVTIRFNEAIGVAAVGLVVNLMSALLLRDHDEHEHGKDADHHDHNLRGAYLHVLADAVTSVLALAALNAGKFLGWTWTDAMTGILGSIVIARWSYGLLQETSAVLLDAEVPEERRLAIQRVIEADADNRLADLHLWRVGPRHLAAIISVVTHEPRGPAHYRRLLGIFPDLAHVTIEVHRCADTGAPESRLCV